MAFSPVWIEKLGNKDQETTRYIPSILQKYIRKFFRLESIIGFLGIFAIIWSIFDDVLLSLAIVLCGMSIFMILSGVFSLVYRYILVLITAHRYAHFPFFDGIRALTRPLMPSIPITISLVSMTVFFILF